MTTPTARADARNRAARTFWQGLVVDVLVAVAAIIATWATEADLTSTEAWTGLGLLVGKTVLVTGASYVARLKAPPA